MAPWNFSSTLVLLCRMFLNSYTSDKEESMSRSLNLPSRQFLSSPLPPLPLISCSSSPLLFSFLSLFCVLICMFMVFFCLYAYVEGNTENVVSRSLLPLEIGPPNCHWGPVCHFNIDVQPHVCCQPACVMHMLYHPINIRCIREISINYLNLKHFSI